MSGYTGALAFKSKMEVPNLAKRILKSFPFSVRGGTMIVDSGSEFLGSGTDKANYFTQSMNEAGLKLSVLPTGRSAVHVEGKNREIRQNVNDILARRKSKRWIDYYKTVVKGLNTTPFTDWRAPNTPLEITKYSKEKQKKLFFRGKDAKTKKQKGRRGPRMKQLEPG